MIHFRQPSICSVLTLYILHSLNPLHMYLVKHRCIYAWLQEPTQQEGQPSSLAGHNHSEAKGL